MGPISVTADAGLDILRRVALGELEIHGILLRESGSKRFRYILRGFEKLADGVENPMSTPPLEQLKSLLNTSQLLQIVNIAQNAAIALSVHRIEERVAAIETRLANIEVSLKRLEGQQALILNALRAAPASRIRAAKRAAIIARGIGNTTAMIAAGKDLEQSFLELLTGARQVVQVKEDGLPVALRLPADLAGLAESATEAASIASAVWLALGEKAGSARLMHEAAEGMSGLRNEMAKALSHPGLMLERARGDEGQDEALIETGNRLRKAELWAVERAIMIEQSLIEPDPDRLEFERMAPTPGGLSLQVCD